MEVIAKYFGWFEELGPKCRPFLIYQTTNQKPIMISLWFFTPSKMCSETIKNGKYFKLKIK